MTLKKNGFTLMELMVSVALMVVLLSAVMGFAQYMLRSSQMSARALQLQDLENQVRGAISNFDMIWASASHPANGGATGALSACLALETDATLDSPANASAPITNDCTTPATTLGTLAELRKSQFPIPTATGTLQLSDFTGYRALSVVSRTSAGALRFGAPEVTTMGSHGRTFFTLEGQPCIGATAASLQCPIRVGLIWRPRCDGSSTSCSMADSIDIYYSIYSPFWDPQTATYVTGTPAQLSNSIPGGIKPLAGRVNLMTRGAENKMTVAVATSTPSDSVQNCLVVTFDNAITESRVFCSQGTNSYSAFTTTSNFTSPFWASSPCTFSLAMVQIVSQRSPSQCTVGATVGSGSPNRARFCGVYVVGVTSLGGQTVWLQNRVGVSNAADPRTSIQPFLTEAATATKTHFKRELINLITGAATIRDTPMVDFQGFRFIANESLPPKKYTFEFVDGSDWSSLPLNQKYTAGSPQMKFSITAGNTTSGVPSALDPVKGCQLVPFGT